MVRWCDNEVFFKLLNSFAFSLNTMRRHEPHPHLFQIPVFLSCLSHSLLNGFHPVPI